MTTMNRRARYRGDSGMQMLGALMPIVILVALGVMVGGTMAGWWLQIDLTALVKSVIDGSVRP